MGKPPITAEEEHTARLMRAELKTIEYIARHLGRSRSAIGRVVQGRTILHVHERHDTKLIVPDSVIADRERRYALATRPRELTALLMGDPIEARHGR